MVMIAHTLKTQGIDNKDDEPDEFNINTKQLSINYQSLWAIPRQFEDTEAMRNYKIRRGDLAQGTKTIRATSLHVAPFSLQVPCPVVTSPLSFSSCSLRGKFGYLVKEAEGPSCLRICAT